MASFASIPDVESLFRPLTEDEKDKAGYLLPVVSDCLRHEAKKVGKDLDAMIDSGELPPTVAMAVTVDIVTRVIMTPTKGAPMTQMSQSALGYSVSGTYLSPGGGIFIKRSELSRLGLSRQKVGVIELYDTGNNG